MLSQANVIMLFSSFLTIGQLSSLETGVSAPSCTTRSRLSRAYSGCSVLALLLCSIGLGSLVTSWRLALPTALGVSIADATFLLLVVSVAEVF